MLRIPLLRARYLRTLLDALKRAGVPAAQLQEWQSQAGLPAWAADNPDCPITVHALRRLATLAASADPAELLARAAIAQGPGLARPLLVAAQPQGSTAHPAVRFCTLARTETSGTIFSLTNSAGSGWLQLRRLRETDGPDPLEALWVVVAAQFLRQSSGEAWSPTVVLTRFPLPAVLQTLGPLQGCRFARAKGPTSIALGRKIVFRSAATADASPLPRLAHSLPGACQQLIRAFLDFDTCRLESLATLTGMSVRTLQRELSSRGTSYRQLVNQIRMQRSSELLRRPDARVTDVALRVGYADPAHFTRAFRSWYGVSPSEFRDGGRLVAVGTG